MDKNGNSLVAVIAVHGVGDHIPSETARSVADILVNLNRDEKVDADYEPFVEEKCDIAIKLEGTDSPPQEKRKEDGEKKRLGVFNERQDYLLELQSSRSGKAQDLDDFGYEFMRQQIETVDIPENEPPYQTVRFKSLRRKKKSLDKNTTGQADTDVEVHVYEMFWDDLSKVGSGFLTIFGELYQLLLHLPSIGRKTVDFALAENPDSWLWKCHSNWQARAARFLTIPIPILNLFLLAAFLTVLPGNFPSVAKPAVSLGLLALIMMSVMFWWFLKHAPQKKVQRIFWMLVPLISTAMVAALYHFIGEPWSSKQAGFGFDKLLAIEWWVATGLGVVWITGYYERMRPGTLRFAKWTGLFVVSLLLYEVSVVENSHFGVTAAGFHVAEFLFLALFVSWALFAVCAFSAMLCGVLLSFSSWPLVRFIEDIFSSRRERPISKEPANQDHDERKAEKEKRRDREDRSVRAAFTARLSLALSVTGFLIVTLAFYSGLNLALGSLLPEDANYMSRMDKHMIVFPKAGLLHEKDFLQTSGQDDIHNAVDKFVGYLKQSQTLSTRNLKKYSPEMNQLLTEYNYSSKHRAAFISLLNSLLQVEDNQDIRYQAIHSEENGMHPQPPNSLYQPRDKRLLMRRKALEAAFDPFIQKIDKRKKLYLSEVINRMFGVSATPMLVVTFGAMVIAVLLAIWALLPSALSEAIGSFRWGEEGTGMGEWMNNGLRLLRISGELIYWSVVILLPVGSFAYLLVELGQGTFLASIANRVWGLRTFLDWGMGRSEEIISWLGVLVTSSAVGLFAFRGRIETLSLGLRAPLQATLDVDNWLREAPTGATPRGRISARYLSLLRTLLKPTTQPDGNHKCYDAIVIIAHSQGTVITADLLRFLNKESSTDSDYIDNLKNDFRALGKQCPVYFMTLGSPLRQAYAARFPHLYAWMRHSKQKPRDSSDPEKLVLIHESHLPDPAALGIEQWVSAYRSGDYIGRYFWFSDEGDQPWKIHVLGSEQNISEDPEKKRRELCIGAGAHVHYFDLEMRKGAAIVAYELDNLIKKAAKRSRSAPS